MKKILMVIGAIILAALIAGGSFWGGMAYQNTDPANFPSGSQLPYPSPTGTEP